MSYSFITVSVKKIEIRLLTDVIWHCMFPFTSHGTAFWYSFLFLIILLFFFFLFSTILSGGGEVREFSKCWRAASDIVSDYNDNSAKIGNSA